MICANFIRTQNMIAQCDFAANGVHKCKRPPAQEGFTADYYPYHSDSYDSYDSYGYNGYNGNRYPTFDVGYQPGYSSTVIIREQPVYVREYPPSYYGYYQEYPRKKAQGGR